MFYDVFIVADDGGIVEVHVRAAVPLYELVHRLAVQVVLVCLEEVFEIFLEDGPLGLDIVDILRYRLGCNQVVEFVAFAEIEFDQPCRQHHTLGIIL